MGPIQLKARSKWKKSILVSRTQLAEMLTLPGWVWPSSPLQWSEQSPPTAPGQQPSLVLAVAICLPQSAVLSTNMTILQQENIALRSCAPLFWELLCISFHKDIMTLLFYSYVSIFIFIGVYSTNIYWAHTICYTQYKIIKIWFWWSYEDTNIKWKHNLQQIMTRNFV